MRRLMLAVWMVALSGSLQAECLEVTDSGFETQEREVAPSVTWHASIRNRCELDYDADLTVVFVDAEGESLYEVQDLVTVGRDDTVATGKSVYMPSEYIPRLAALEISIEERERPF